MQYAYQAGADWIWCMDDDVFPRADCLERLLQHAGREDIGILAPKQTVTGPVEIQGAAFEGPFIRREVVGKIGYPNKDLFIFCDDTDYCLRTVQAGFRILYVPDALMDKEKFFSNDSWSERSKKKKWKRFYQVRNSTYLSHHYGRNWAVRYLRGFNGVAGYILTALVTCPFTDAYRWSDIPKLWKAYCDGIHERLGKID